MRRCSAPASHRGYSLHVGRQRPGQRLFIALENTALYNHSSAEQVRSSQETEAQTGSGRPKVTKNKQHWSVRTGHQAWVLCGPQLSQGDKGQDV